MIVDNDDILKIYEFIQCRIAKGHYSHAIQTPAMTERGGVPVRRSAVGVRSHLAAAIADRAYTVIKSTCKAYVSNTRMSGGARAPLVLSAVVVLCFSIRRRLQWRAGD
eukprot:6198671-Pleurochrysis_carterae.AAC.3